jgi:hypothetical protein
MKEYTMSRIQHVSRSTIARIAGIVVAFLLLGILLAACGSNTGGGGQTTPTPTQPTQTVNCGKVHSLANKLVPTDKAAAQQAENCFYQAYQKCQPATLMFSTIGVDAGYIHNLAVKSANGSCAVSDGWQHFIAPKPPSSITTYTCVGMTMQNDGLHLDSCGQAGSFVIPSA